MDEDLSKTLDEVLDEDTVEVADPDADNWQVPLPPPKDIFVREFKKSGEEPVVLNEETEVHVKAEYKSIRENLPSQMYSLMSWLPPSPNYPLSITPTADDITLAVMDAFCQAFKQINPEHVGHIEIEGRLGLLVNKNQRIFLDCASESILYSNSKSRGFLYRQFAAEMFPKDMETLMHYIKTHKSKKAIYLGEKILSDEIFKGFRVRKYEKDTKEGKVIAEEITKKHQLVTLDIYNPRYKYDYRIQINIEEPLDRIPSNELTTMQRRTKRYKCQHFNIGYDFSEIEQTVILPQGNQHRTISSAEIEALNPRDTFYKHYTMKENGNPSRMYISATSGQ
eukprot:NODE_632_length_5195_cov_0.634812.p2 type:complete len:337 gc:universal NODE_632_length_5195_cov_0.634812:3658-2648(-)